MASTAPSLMTLPAELRLHIYYYLLTGNEGCFLLLDPPLMLTCRQIQSEMLEPYYAALNAEQHDLMRENLVLEVQKEELRQDPPPTCAVTGHIALGYLFEIGEVEGQIDDNIEFCGVLRDRAKEVEEKLRDGLL